MYFTIPYNIDDINTINNFNKLHNYLYCNFRLNKNNQKWCKIDTLKYILERAKL